MATETSNARHSMSSAEWYTPGPFVAAARVALGGVIDLDPASSVEANHTIRARTFYTAADDGLAKPWAGRMLIDPPGGKDANGVALVPQFWRKLIREWSRGLIPQAIWIGYSLEQLQTLQRGQVRTPAEFPICIPSARIAFDESDEAKLARVERLIAKGDAPGASERARRIAAECRAGRPPRNAPSHANYVVCLGGDPAAFLKAFSAFGVVRA